MLGKGRNQSALPASFSLSRYQDTHLTPGWRRCPGLSCGKGQAGPAGCSCLWCQTHGTSPKPLATGAGEAEVKCPLAWVMTLISNIQIPGMDSLELAHLELPRAMAGRFDVAMAGFYPGWVSARHTQGDGSPWTPPCMASGLSAPGRAPFSLQHTNFQG